MRFSPVAATLFLAGIAVAQVTWEVLVGGPTLANGASNLTFTPNQLPAAPGNSPQVAPGDIIIFTLYVC